jgi:hypothetical protein
MNYSAIYAELMMRAQARTLTGYVERHHILPRCLGGSDEPENIASLTPREHFLAHLLLVKMHPGHNGLSFAAHMMGRQGTLDRSRDYAWVRARVSADQSRRMAGVPRSEAAMAGLVAARHAPKSAEHRAKLAAANKGKRASEETRARLSVALTGRPVSDRARQLTSEYMKGRRHGLGNRSRTGLTNSPETRAKIAAAQTGRKHSPERRENISKGQASLSESQVQALRADFDSKALSLSAISRKYGVSWSQAGRIAKRVAYRWVA